MCYERRRAEACVDESAHHALVTAYCVCVYCVLFIAIYYCSTVPIRSCRVGEAQGMSFCFFGIWRKWLRKWL